MNNREFDSQELHFAYQHLSHDIEHTKRRQWSIPYYILLLFAAIVGFVKLYDPCRDTLIAGIFLPAIALGICIVGTYHVVDVHFIQVTTRRNIHRLIYPYRHVIHDSLIPEERNLASKYYLLSLTFFFVAVIIIGLVFVLTYLKAGLEYIIFLPGSCLVWAIGVYFYKENKLEQKLPYSSFISDN